MVSSNNLPSNKESAMKDPTTEYDKYHRCPICGQEGPDVYAEELYDARGIYCGRACETCMPKLKAKYRPDVLTNANYQLDEPIEEPD